MRRRDILLQAAVLPIVAALGRTARAEESTPFDGATVRNLARDLAQRAYQAPDATLPDPLKNLEYQDYRSIRFDPGHALWRGQGLRFTAEFFHRGFLYKEAVKIFEVANGRAELIRYSPDLFTFDKVKPPTGDIGFAGFRLHYPLNRAGLLRRDLRLSRRQLFPRGGEGPGLRPVGARAGDQDRGSRRRGVPAVPLVLAGAAGARAATRSWSMRCSTARVRRRRSASPSVPASRPCSTPRWRCIRAPTSRTVGIAPLTSMFLFDANDRTRVDDYREAVHDSNGLLLWTGKGEQVWRPLANPRELQISAFSDSGPRGFGLMQRGRSFGDYQDLEAHYEKRPSLWVEPIGDWGEGVVELVEIPTDREVNDNIVAFWRPHDPLKAKGEYILNYRLHWCWSVPAGTHAGRGRRDALRPGVGSEEPPVRHRFRRRRAEGPSGGRAAHDRYRQQQGQDRESGRGTQSGDRRLAAQLSAQPGQREAGRDARPADGRRQPAHRDLALPVDSLTAAAVPRAAR